MKRYFAYLTAVLAAGAVFFSCQKNQEEDKAHQAREIKFSASVGAFDIKATDTSLEKGDQVGIFALGDITSFANLRATWDGQYLVPDQTTYWSEYQDPDTPCPFYAYYPYQADVASETFTFTVHPDQSSHAGYTASDLMTADTRATPASGEVHFNFVHRLSKLILKIDNRLGANISELYLDNVYGRANVGPGAYYSLEGKAGTIKAGKVTLTDGTSAWALIVVPQSTNPVLMVTTAEGKQYTFNVRNSVELKSGRRYSATVILDENVTSTEITTDVTDWIDDADIQFGQNEPPVPQDGEWSVIGTIHGSNWDVDFPMDQYASDAWYGYIYYQEGEEFKLRMNYAWDVNLGGKIGLYGDYLSQDGANITLQETGLYEMLFFPQENYLYISHAGEMKSWSVIGNIMGTNWDTDFPMTVGTVWYDSNGPKYPALIFNGLEYKAGDSFKLRFMQEWALDYGVEEDILDPQGSYNLVKYAKDITLSREGTYVILIDWVNRRLNFIDNSGAEIDAANIAEVVNGNDGDYYTVSGTVSRVNNIAFGNFWMEDETGELYIYGLKNQLGQYPRDVENSWYTEDFGLIPGDYVTVKGPKKTYNGTPELVDTKMLDIQRLPLGAVWSSATFGQGEAEGVVYIRSLFGAPEASVQADWANVTNIYQISDSWYAAWIYLSANTAPDTRYTQVIFNAGGASYPYDLIQEGLPAETDDLSKIVSLADGTQVAFTAQVYAVTTRGFVVSDGKYGFLVYTGANVAQPAYGDVVKVVGTKTTYNNVAEISNQNLSFEILSTGNPKPYPSGCWDITSSMFDSLLVEFAYPVKVEGTLQVSGNYYNIVTDGGGVAQIYWPDPDLGLSADMAGMRIEAQGFYNGYNGKVHSIIVTDISEGNDPWADKGTLDNPFSPSEIAAAVLGGATFDRDIFIRGKVSAVLYTFDANYGTGTFWLSDDGIAHGISENKKTTTEPYLDFECYGVYWYDGQPWADGNEQVEVGDEVIVCGQVTIYNGVAETANKKAWVYALYKDS